jgi:hypothetical protein
MWFGPKGSASAIYALIVLEEGILAADAALHLATLTIVLSLEAHSSPEVVVVCTFDEEREVPVWHGVLQRVRARRVQWSNEANRDAFEELDTAPVGLSKDDRSRQPERVRVSGSGSGVTGVVSRWAGTSAAMRRRMLGGMLRAESAAAGRRAWRWAARVPWCDSRSGSGLPRRQSACRLMELRLPHAGQPSSRSRHPGRHRRRRRLHETAVVRLCQVG